MLTSEVLLESNERIGYTQWRGNMKTKMMAVGMILAVIFSFGCSTNDQTEKLKTGKYDMQGAPMEDWAWILLNEDYTFEFNRNLATSYRPRGSYSIENGELILFVNDAENYKFTLEDEKLIFESGEFAETLIEKGTIFEWVKD